MATYNVTRFTRQVLKRHRREPPSLILHLYPGHFRFEHQHGNFAYDSPMKCFLEAIREQKLPTDLLDVLDEANVRYYDGCLIVEVHDHRSAPQPTALARPGLALSFATSETRTAPSSFSKAEVYRIVLGSNPATLWTELGILEKRREREIEKANEEAANAAASANGANGVNGTANGAGGLSGIVRKRHKGWTEEEAVEMEAIILNRTTAPLCLSPSLQTTRIANSLLRATTLRPPKKRRTSSNLPGGTAADGDEDEAEEIAKRDKEERERIMKIGDEGVGRSRGHAFARLAFIEANRLKMSNPHGSSAPNSAATSAPAPAPAAQNQGQAQGPTATSSGITSIRLGLGSAAAANAGASGGSTPHGSPPPQGVKPKKKSMGGADSETGTPGPSAVPPPKKKKASMGGAGISLDPNDPTLPTDPEAKAAELAERKKQIAARKRAESKAKQKEKKEQERREAERAQMAGDLQVGGGDEGTAAAPQGPTARFSWASGGVQ